MSFEGRAVRFDHVGVPARDAAGSARFLAGVLGLAEPVPDGEDGDMFRVDLALGGFVLFADAETVAPVHVAFRVDRPAFAAIVARLRASGVAFGNDHGDPTNGRTEDPLGGEGRVYFRDRDAHLWEVAC